MSLERSSIFFEKESNFVLLETLKVDNENTKTLFFFNPIDVIQTNSIEGVPAAFQRIEEALQRGYYLAGYLTYECGYYFEELAGNDNFSQPLLWFGVYQQPVVLEEDSRKNRDFLSKDFRLENTRFSISDDGSPATLEEYAKKISRVKWHIQEGDVYQINFTGRMLFELTGSSFGLYDSLRKKQRVGYAAYIQTEEQTILSLSPEMFFKRNGNRITVKPMKGTAKRGRTVTEDEEIKLWLATDNKSRAENVMIVDVLRNDLGKVSEIGSMKTTALYEVEQYDTLFQMTSTVEANLREGVSYYDLFKALFPCGSVTGAPKRRAMEIIRELEPTPRGIYTGAIGYISPDNDAVFSVAIRTVTLAKKDDARFKMQDSPDAAHNPSTTLPNSRGGEFHGTMGTGGGIVWDSKAEDELKECELKAQFLSQPYEEFQLIETMLWKDGIQLLELHLERLRESCEYFGFRFDGEEIRKTLQVSCFRFHAEMSYRVRLTINRTGKINIESNPIEEHRREGQLAVKIALQRTDSSDRFLFHKTTQRKLYDEMFHRAAQEELAEFIFLNEREEVTEGTISNIFIKRGETYYTPPVECGLLNGVYRRHLLKTLPDVQEKILFLQDLEHADAMYLCNAVRGMREVKLSIPFNPENTIS
ncbi:MAG: aminodeoxychorismate synthase, component I [Bacteroidetes bacterium]|nr:MAG: aminodeoxychorismate synthase, component I [Bacteroidota bacterium]